MCIMKSEYTLIKGNGSIMYIPHYKKHPTLIFTIFRMANLFYANYDNNSLYQLF